MTGSKSVKFGDSTELACACILRGFWSPLRMEQSGLLPLDTSLIEICFTCFMGIIPVSFERFALVAEIKERFVNSSLSPSPKNRLNVHLHLWSLAHGLRCPGSCRLPGWVQHALLTSPTTAASLPPCLKVQLPHSFPTTAPPLSLTHSQNSNFLSKNNKISPKIRGPEKDINVFMKES